MSKKRKFEFKKQRILPGFAEGRYEPRHNYDHTEFANSLEGHMKRDSRISIRVSGEDLAELQRRALACGIPTQTLTAHILHRYLNGELEEVASGSQAERPATRLDPLPTKEMPRDRDRD